MMQLALALPLWRVQVRRSAERGHWAWDPPAYASLRAGAEGDGG